MDKKKRLVFNYFDTIYSGYKKSGRRPVRMPYPNVLFEYKNEDGNVAFEFNTSTQILNFNNKDFYTGLNMLGLTTSEFANICKEYASDKFDEISILRSPIYNTLKGK
jgi:hypothetical protein